MKIKEKLEEKIYKTERHLNELSIQIERFRQEHQELMHELGLTTEELEEFAESRENFPEFLGEDLQREKKQINERLDLAFNQLNNMNKTQSTISEKGKIQQHWMFVR